MPQPATLFDAPPPLAPFVRLGLCDPGERRRASLMALAENYRALVREGRYADARALRRDERATRSREPDSGHDLLGELSYVGGKPVPSVLTEADVWSIHCDVADALCGWPRQTYPRENAPQPIDHA